MITSTRCQTGEEYSPIRGEGVRVSPHVILGMIPKPQPCSVCGRPTSLILSWGLACSAECDAEKGRKIREGT